MPGVLDASGVARSLSGVIGDISGTTLMADGLRKLRAVDLDSPPRLAPGRVTRSEALSHVAGYLTVNDLSERAFQLERGGQWVKGKSCDTFGPLGPWLVTPSMAERQMASDTRTAARAA